MLWFPEPSGSVWTPHLAWRSTSTSESPSSAGEVSHNLHPGVKLHTAEVQWTTALVRRANLPGRFLAPPENLEGEAAWRLGLISLTRKPGRRDQPRAPRQFFRWAWPPGPSLLPWERITSPDRPNDSVKMMGLLAVAV